MAKREIKIVILFVLIIAVLIGGWRLYNKLEKNKQSFSVDIYEYISPQAVAVININREYNLDMLYQYDPSLRSLTGVLGENLSFPTIISKYKDNSSILITKIKQEKESEIADYIRNQIASDFPPHKREYKDAIVWYFTLPDDKFLVCSFYKGMLAISNHLRPIEIFIDSDSENTFFSDENNIELITKIRNSTPVCIFTKVQDKTLALNYVPYNSSIQLIGYILENKEKAANDSIAFDYATIPLLMDLPDRICIDSINIQNGSKPVSVKIFLNKKF
ncbi:hypothetical protein [Dysgonomonas sp. Marseille-Q5470]|uniref:hypothetical protein n=1 Tax=Dysgonomonas sp. Marseille-Q5470 TaxID=3039494 RepID=UPI0024BD4531|nr:hypothetical protein [Dysgonomonas sp. Marseille-Q5470]